MKICVESETTTSDGFTDEKTFVIELLGSDGPGLMEFLQIWV
jgi:hypothetical protein